jgi:cystathionine beta-lyase/cystathionine gamma-synthase
VVQGEDARIRLGWPDTGERELAEVAEVLETGMLTMGPKVAEFEAEIARICEVEHAVAVSSGTAALHLAEPCDLGLELRDLQAHGEHARLEHTRDLGELRRSDVGLA